MEKLLRQAGICIIILLSVMVLKGLNISAVDKALEVGSQQISKDYSIDDIMTFGTKAVETVKGTHAVMVNAVAPSSGIRYGEPIDEMVSGAVSQVYSVSGGTVIAVGEDEQYGKYVKIAHGKESESMYGNCKEIYVRPLERVKKGQVIAEYDVFNEQDFYYTLSYLK
jgi:hypothetical protein